MKSDMGTVNKLLLLLLPLSVSLFSHQAGADNRPWGGFSRPDPDVVQPPSPGYQGRYNPWIGQGLTNNGTRSGRALPDTRRYRDDRPLAPGGVPAYGYPYGQSTYPYGGSDWLAPYSGLDYPYYGSSPPYNGSGLGSPYSGGWPGGLDYRGW